MNYYGFIKWNKTSFFIRILSFFLTASCILFILCSLYSGIGTIIKKYGDRAIQSGISSAVIRFHVIANSDSDTDQSVKLKVRDAVSEYLEPLLKDIYDKEAAYKIINNELPKIKAISDDVLNKNGFFYTSNCSTGVVSFPEKTYGDVTLPAGEYDALRIELGEAVGQNWWCIMFPQLCFVDLTNGYVPEMSKQKLKILLTEAEYDTITKKETKVNIRFFLWDKICELFGE